MDLKEIAKRLNGNEYREELSMQDESFAKKHGIVIVFGYSDDKMEFRGAINDEVSCFDGGEAYITKDGLFESCDCECIHSIRVKENAKKIEAIWNKDGYSWIYKTEIPHETFEIVEGNDKYCKGIAFYLKDCV